MTDHTHPIATNGVRLLLMAAQFGAVGLGLGLPIALLIIARGGVL